jgi:hypothetical protein
MPNATAATGSSGRPHVSGWHPPRRTRARPPTTAPTVAAAVAVPSRNLGTRPGCPRASCASRRSRRRPGGEGWRQRVRGLGCRRRCHRFGRPRPSSSYFRAPLLYDGGMYPVPTSLSPSRVEAFTSCPMAFRFASIEKLPEPPSIHATKGSMVHRVLELLFMQPGTQRSLVTAQPAFDQAMAEYRRDPEFTLLGLTEAQQQAFFDDAWSLVQSYFAMEDPIGHSRDRARDPAGSAGRRPRAARHHRPARARRAGWSGGHRLQDRSRPRPAVPAEEPGRRALLLVPVRVRCSVSARLRFA